jgi:hypothetical protein
VNPDLTAVQDDEKMEMKIDLGNGKVCVCVYVCVAPAYHDIFNTPLMLGLHNGGDSG